MNRSQNRSKRRLVLLSASVLLAGAAPGSLAWAQPPSAPMAFDIKAGPLDQALKAYAERLHSQMLYDARLVAGRRAAALRGRYTASEALRRLLAGTDLQADALSPNTIVLRPRASPVRDPAPQPAASRPPADLAQLGPSSVETPRPFAGGAGAGAPNGGPASASVAEVVVTGTHLRGVTDSPSPVVVVSREDMDRRGYGTLTDALQALPQNFGGSANPQSALAGMDASNSNRSARRASTCAAWVRTPLWCW